MKELNFTEDLKKDILETLREEGINISFKQKTHQILIDFLNLKSKLLDVYERNVYIVPSFEKEISKHHKREEILTIIDFAKKGKNLNIFQSEKVIQTKFLDYLSNEWNIYHFHLSLEPLKNNKFVKRGDLLLFAYVENKNIVFLGVGKHKESFGNIEWLEILEKNFPNFLSKYLAYDIPSIPKNLNTLDRKELWSKGVSSGFLNLNGRIYLSPGLGMVTNGINVKILMESNSIMHWIYKIEQKLKNNIENCFKLQLGDNTIEIIDNNTKIIYYKYPNYEKIN